MTAPDVEKATRVLAKLDPVMGAHIKQIGPWLTPKHGGRSHFETLAREITFQQLAGKAAATIWGRVRALVPGRFTPEKVLELDEQQLRGAGLSNNKMLSLLDLAAHVADKRLPLARLSQQSDDVVIEELTRVRGIGRWTAEMFLIFQLCRLDIWPVGDLGVRNGYRLLYGLPELPDVKAFGADGDKFRPYRSIAAWYCWRAVDITLPVDIPRSST